MKARWLLLVMLVCGGELLLTAPLQARTSARAAPASAPALPAFLREGARSVDLHGRTAWMAPLMLQADGHGGITARAASGSVPCSNIFGSHWTNVDHCASTIANSNNGYCLSSYGKRQGAPVREYACDKKSANQIWWMANTGINGTWEVWNAGSSCPSSHAWYHCGEPFGSARGYGYGYCIAVRGLKAGDDVPLVMSGCKSGKIAAMSFYGVGTSWRSASLVYTGSGKNRYCVSSLGHAKDGAGYAIFACNNKKNQRFSAAAFTNATVGGDGPGSGDGGDGSGAGGGDSIQPGVAHTR